VSDDFDQFDQFDKPLAVDRVLRERDIQEPCVRWARGRGTYARKFVSPANRSVPDYLMVTRGWVWFPEFKRPGGKLTKQQEEEHTAMRAAGAEVYVFDNIELFKRKHAEIEARGPLR
jgi:hypothetical protein